MIPNADASSAPVPTATPPHDEPMVQSGYLPFPGLLHLELTPTAHRIPR